MQNPLLEASQKPTDSKKFHTILNIKKACPISFGRAFLLAI